MAKPQRRGKAEKEGPEPQVDLVFAGEGQARAGSPRRGSNSRTSRYTPAFSSRKASGTMKTSRALPGYKPTAIGWKRPFEASWRGDFIVAEGKRLVGLANPQSVLRLQEHQQPRRNGGGSAAPTPLDARFAAATQQARELVEEAAWWEQGDENAPQIWQESLASFFIYPAVFKGDEVRLCLYADKE